MPSESPQNGGRAFDLTPFARATVRLHPRAGTPTARDSHIGGPLLWPADEPWPHCPDTARNETARNETAPGVIHTLAAELEAAHPRDKPMPLGGVAQFFRRDFPKLPFPDGTDLLQVLFCPDPHNSPDYWGPGVQVVWRDSAGVTVLLESPPAPFQSDYYEYLPVQSCSFAPCEFVDHPHPSELPAELNAMLPFTNEHGDFVDDEAEAAWSPVVTGSKLGGLNFWWTSRSQDFPLTCSDCGSGLELLLALETLESQDDYCPCDQPDAGPGWELAGSSVNVPDPDRWLADVEDATERALKARGSATAQQLSEDEPRLRQQLLMAKGKPYEAIANVTSRVLFQLAVDGRIVRGRPRGSWISSQYFWSTMADWLPRGLAEWDADAARVELARKWLYAYGPAPIADLRWWTGWTAGQTKKALAAIRPVEVDLGGVPGIVLADDLEPVAKPEPWVALLPGLDPTPMGWLEREWYLGAHKEPLFDRTGNIGPTVWSDGRIVGGWAQRPDGEVVHHFLEDVGADVERAVAAEANHLAGWFGDVRVTPRFRTPLERRLAQRS